MELNKDVIILILEELQYGNNSLYPCLLVNKTWCEATIPILWRNPWKDMSRDKEKLQSKVITSHLSKENLKSQGIILSAIQQKPSVNYIGFCRYLELFRLERIVISTMRVKKSEISIMVYEMLKLFINKNTKITHLYVPEKFDYQIHLIPGAESCFSELKFLQCHTTKININNHLLEGLSEIIKSIEKLELYILPSNNDHGIIKLIEAQKTLNNIHCVCDSENNSRDELFYKVLKKSLMKNANNLRRLNLENCSCLENVTLPILKILKTLEVSSESLISLIENTKCLVEININNRNDNEKLIQAIYRNCPNLKYLKLPISDSNISEFDNLLINCQYLDGLALVARKKFNWNDLFNILTTSSPISLFKFKFFSSWDTSELESALKLFFDNWKGRHPMLLFTDLYYDKSFDLIIEEYKAEGIVKKYINSNCITFDDFEWILC